MAEVEEPQFTSLKDRIAALNRQKNFEAVDGPAKRAPPPPPPQRPAAEGRSQTLPVPAIATTNVGDAGSRRPLMPPRPAAKAAAPPLPRRPARGSPTESPVPSPSIAPPSLPTRVSSGQSSPALPPRRPTGNTTPSTDIRRNSASSEISHVSTMSTLSLGRTSTSNFSTVSDGSARKLPPTFDPASLPPLPPSRRDIETNNRGGRDDGGEAKSRHPLVTSKTVPNIRQVEAPPPVKPSLPPRLPSRPARSPGLEPGNSYKPATPRRLPPPPAEYKTQTTGHGVNGSAPPPLPSTSRDAREAPPAVPVCSRPSETQIVAVSIKAVANQAATCLICRDFSVPDHVGSQYPRHTVPRNDAIGYLAHNLCAQFSSPTDKARAIFTWMHYNVAYDVEMFHSKALRHVTSDEVIFGGKAVCAGYAGCFEAIAKRAGLECITVGGHGKGYGHAPLRKGAPCPPRNATGHAWNSVRIDNGEWKLIDACWGAGHLGGTGEYKQQFSPNQFSKSNEDFGASHFPEDSRYFFRQDGRIPTWEEYFTGGIDGSPPQIYGDLEGEGGRKESLSPRDGQIPVYSGQVVRFQLSRPCEHWTFERNGKGPPRLFLLAIKGEDGRNETRLPLETDGFWWWADVNARDLGAPGQDVTLMSVTIFDGKDARGLSKEEYLRRVGRVGMSFSFLAKWDLV